LENGPFQIEKNDRLFFKRLLKKERMQADFNEFDRSVNEDDGGELIKALQLDENQNLSARSGKKLDYHARKLDGRLKKYEFILKNAERIRRVDESKVDIYIYCFN